MKKSVLTFLSLIIATCLISQVNKPSSVYFKSGNKIFTNNISSFVNDNSNEELIQNRYYKLVQFNSIPSQSEKETMIASGLIFQEYIPKNTYLISFPGDFNKNLLLSWNVFSVNPLSSTHRISELATELPFPEWAMLEKNVQLYISFYEDLNFNLCVESLSTHKINIISKEPLANKILISINPDKVNSLLTVNSIRLIDLIPEPGKKEHELSRNMHRSSSINTRYPGGRKYDGTGVVVVDNDDGIVGPHIDFTGRMTQPGVTGTTGTHGDMTAGIIGGCGNLDPMMAGMATGCDLIIQNYNSTLPNTVTFHTNDSAVLFNSSYSNGCNAGYTSLARKVDQEIRQNPNMIQVFSAGNSNNTNCSYGAGNQWGNITGGHKQGKNVIATANLESNTILATSSSRGPAADGRIKPDIAAHGNGNYSTAPNNAYLYGSGTSAAAPSIAGTMAQMYHAYKVNNAGVTPKSGLMKAIILNTAEDFGNVGPDFKFGWGRVNGLRAIKSIEEARYFSSTISNTGVNNHQISVPSNVKEVKVMVYWHDYEGSTSASPALVNNLNTKMTLGTSTFMPWLLDHTPTTTALNTPATKGIDSINNVEQVSIVNPVAGTYTLKVEGIAVPQGPQEYFVTYDFIYDDITLINPNGGEGFVTGETNRLFWDAYGTTGSFTLTYSIDSGSTWNSIGTSLGTARYRDWSVPSAVTGKALVAISRGSISDTSDHTFSIINTPSNLSVIKVCPTYMEVSWNAVTGADEYEIYVLGNKYMDSVGRTTSTTFQIPITNPANDRWYSVAAIKSNNSSNVGRRAEAEYYAGGLFNCILPTDAGVTAIVNPSAISCIVGAANITITVANLGLNSISNIPVKYRINGGAIQSGTATGTLAASGTTNYTFSTSYNFTTTGLYSIVAWTELTGDLYSANDTIYYNYNHGNIITIPFTENFNSFTNCATSSDCEANICNLNNGYGNLSNSSEDDIDWRTNTGSTPSSNTGPSGDHTSGFGKYLYIEASGSCYGKKAVMVSPCIDLGTSISNPGFTFWYHMYGGTTLDTLTVDIFDGTNWQNDLFKQFGDQGNQWKKAYLDLTPFTGNIIKIRVNGTTGNFWNTDIAIDDFNISDYTSVEENELTKSVSIYPNPSNGEFNVSIDNSKFSDVIISVFDVYGRLIHTNRLKSQNNVIQLSNFSAGIYTVKISSNGESMIKRVIIN